MKEPISESSTAILSDMVAKKPIRILHVDDDLGCLKVAQQCLGTQGEFQIETVSSVEKAIERMKKENFDVIVSDFKMPGKDGLEFLKELREKGDDVPFIIFTGKGREEVAVKALNLGATGYFNKSGAPETVYGELAHGIRQVVERKRAEEALKESQTKYKSLCQNIPGLIYRARPDWSTEIISNSKNTCGYSIEEFNSGRVNWLDVIHPDDKEKVIKEAKSIRERPKNTVQEYRIADKEGKVRWVEDHKTSFFSDEGAFEGVDGVVFDITERKKTQELARASEERYRSYIHLVGQLGWTTNAYGEVEEDILAWRRFTGQSYEEVKGWGWTKALHPDDLGHTTQTWEKAVAAKSAYEVEYRIRRHDRIYRHFLIRGIPVLEENGSIREWVGTCIDITERKKAEEAFRRSAEQARSLLEFQNKIIDTATVWIDLLDIEGNVTLWNRAAELISGYSREEVIGHKKIWEWCYPDPQYRAKIFARTRETIDHEESSVQNFETVFRCKNGALKTISWYSNSITDREGKPVGSIVIGLDVSQLKKAERELRGAMEKLQVVGGLTRHDVRNKLSVITGNVYLARKKLLGNIEVLDYLKQIEASVEQTVRILDFAKVYEMLGVEQLMYVDLEKTVDEAISLLPDLKGIKIRNDCYGLTVLVDSLLTQLFYNLVDNALKYGKKLSRIRVYFEEKNDHMNIICEDDGVGVSADEKPRLFKEGYSTGGSTGHGLYLIRKMTEVYGWTIEETGKSGEGARFAMTIPKTNPNGRKNYRILKQ